MTDRVLRRAMHQRSRKNRLDVDDGRAIDDFDGADAQPVLGYLTHGDRMKA